MSSDSRDKTRRYVLQSLGAASAAGLAGCGGGGQGQGRTDTGGGGDQQQGDQQGQQELGERVPQVTMMYFSNAATTPITEQRMQIAAENLTARLGIQTKLEPTELITAVNQILNDKRTSALPHTRFNLKPRRIDPTDTLNNIQMTAFAVGGGMSNYASENACEYEDLYFKQLAATDDEQRQDIVTKMMNIASEDVAVIPFMNSLLMSVWNTEKLDPRSLGRLAVSQQNPKFFIDSSPTEGDTIVAESTVEVLGSIQPSRHTGGMPVWSQLVNSGLRIFDENLELKNLLANSVEIEKDGERVIVELIDDAVFQNGDPITSEDVKFTFDYIAENPPGAPEFVTWPHDSIEIIDERTTQFNLKWPNNILPRIDFAMAGIWHKDSMIEAGATEDPANYKFDDVTNLVGSGPFRPVHAEAGSTMRLEPFEDHPVFDVDHNLQFKSFNNKQTAIQSFKNGELHTLFRLQYQVFEQLQGSSGTDGKVTQGWTPTGIWPQFTFAPSMFREFRAAVSQALDREKMNQLTAGGSGTEQLHGGPLPSTHPWHEEEKITDISPSPSGDAEVARQTLRDAGWGWDDNDNLHYPADADLSPLWPQGETPSPENYPCLEKGATDRF